MVLLQVVQVTQPSPPSGSSHQIGNWAVVFATLFGPILAVLITRWIDKQRESRDRKLWIFKTLMATRDSNMTPSPEHIQALHMIEIEFRGGRKKDKEVVDAWKLYQQHINLPQQPEDIANYWGKRQFELYCQLIHRISKRVGYSLSEAQIREVYSPKGAVLRHIQENVVWDGLANLFGQGGAPLKVRLVVADEDKPGSQAFLRLVSGKSPLVVRLLPIGSEDAGDQGLEGPGASPSQSGTGNDLDSDAKEGPGGVR